MLALICQCAAWQAARPLKGTVYALLLTAWSKLGRVDDAFATMDDMQLQKIDVGPVAHGCILFALGTSGRMLVRP